MYPDGADVSDDDDDDKLTGSGFISDSDENRARSSDILTTAALGSEYYELEVRVKRTAKDIITTENKVIFEQLKEYSNHLEKFGANRLHDILAIYLLLKGIYQRGKRGNVVETGACSRQRRPCRRSGGSRKVFECREI